MRLATAILILISLAMGPIAMMREACATAQATAAMAASRSADMTRGCCEAVSTAPVASPSCCETMATRRMIAPAPSPRRSDPTCCTGCPCWSPAPSAPRGPAESVPPAPLPGPGGQQVLLLVSILSGAVTGSANHLLAGERLATSQALLHAGHAAGRGARAHPSFARDHALRQAALGHWVT